MISFPNPKINIGLDIVRRRPDGYHDIVTAMVPVKGGWRDVLEAVPSNVGHDTLTVSGRPCDCPANENLVIKALGALRREGVRVPPLDIYLMKVIPDGAGLGGGSADAAFMLRMAAEFAGRRLSDEFLAGVAATVGADCPLFVYNRPMLATGTGTTLHPIDIPGLSGRSVVIVKPADRIPTSEAYRGVTPSLPDVDLAAIITQTLPPQWDGTVKNDFERSVFSAHPVISDIKQKLIEAGAVYASMSGSGSAVYGIFDRADIPVSLPEIFEGCEVMVSDM